VTVSPAERALQSRLTLTAHPLQRIGAYAIAALAGRGHGPDMEPQDVSGDQLDRVLELMTEHAIRAALVRDSKGPNGFWLKVSYSFFPNAPMNHPGNGKKTDDEIRAAVRKWRCLPEPASWPAAGCVLCGRQSVAFFGKVDVALAESESYRNTTPRGHAGMALCRPCVASFHALPYGSQLTGGISYALHSWDESFLKQTVARQVDRNLKLAETGDGSRRPGEVREVLILTALKNYGERLTAGVDLLIFSNSNRGQLMEIRSLEQPLAEWLRRLASARQKRGFTALVRAHVTANTPGVVNLARNAFGQPTKIVSSSLRRLATTVTGAAPDRAEIADLAALLYSFVTEVLLMHEKDLSEIRATARNVAGLLNNESTAGQLRKLRSSLREPIKLRQWLTGQGVTWAIKPPDGADGPLVTERAYALLFGPGPDNPAWFHRDLLLVGVLEQLSQLGWRATDPDQSDEDDDPLEGPDSDLIKDDTEVQQ